MTGSGPAISRHLDALRATIPRVTPEQARTAVADGALLIDTRGDAMRARHGELPGAIVIERNVLEWRLDPTSPWRIPEMDDPTRVVIITCQEGYASSLAVASLRAIGIDARDLDGGADAWRATGLPLSDDPPDVRE